MPVVVRRYAQALFSLSKEKGAVNDTEAEARRLLTWLVEASDFKAFITRRFGRLKETQDALTHLSQKAGLSMMTTSFLMLLAEKSRLPLLEKCLQAFLDLVDQENNLIRGQVKAVTLLSEAHLDRLKKLLSQKLHKKVDLTPLADPKILGGMVLKVGPYLIDSSLESRLTRLETRLKG